MRRSKMDLMVPGAGVKGDEVRSRFFRLYEDAFFVDDLHLADLLFEPRGCVVTLELRAEIPSHGLKAPSDVLRRDWSAIVPPGPGMDRELKALIGQAPFGG